MAPITLAMLSWGYHETLINTLNSYQELGLLSLVDERVIFFQEYSEEDKAIAMEYGFDSFGSPDNIGIAEGYNLLAAYASGEFFLFLENDWKLLEDPKDAILEGGRLLESGVDLIRYRHRDNPGNPLWTRQFEGREYDKPTHLLDAIHWKKNMLEFKEMSRAFTFPTNEWYVTTSRNANWTNNPHMARTSFIQDKVIPHIGVGDLEQDIQSWWENQIFLVAQGKGLFTHERSN